MEYHKKKFKKTCAYRLCNQFAPSVVAYGFSRKPCLQLPPPVGRHRCYCTNYARARVRTEWYGRKAMRLNFLFYFRTIDVVPFEPPPFFLPHPRFDRQ